MYTKVGSCRFVIPFQNANVQPHYYNDYYVINSLQETSVTNTLWKKSIHIVFRKKETTKLEEKRKNIKFILLWILVLNYISTFHFSESPADTHFQLIDVVQRNFHWIIYFFPNQV